MKYIFELNIIYTNGVVGNLLFTTKEAAEKRQKIYCRVGTNSTLGIAGTYINKRVLFE